MSLGDRIVVMSHGRVAQIGTPREIYFEPQDEFVADFIGIMNRIDGTISDGVFETRGGRVSVVSTRSGSARALFRPENVSIVSVDQANLKGFVNTAFFLGDRTRLVISGICDEDVTVETDNRIVYQPGDEIGLSIDPQALLIL